MSQEIDSPPPHIQDDRYERHGPGAQPRAQWGEVPDPREARAYPGGGGDPGPGDVAGHGGDQEEAEGGWGE